MMLCAWLDIHATMLFHYSLWVITLLLFGLYGLTLFLASASAMRLCSVMSWLLR